MMDIRHPMTDFDLADARLGDRQRHAPMHILLTKADKLTYGAPEHAAQSAGRNP